MSRTVLTPWLPGCPYRERAWSFVRGRYTWPVVEALGGSPWNKGRCVNAAVRSSTADIVAIVDADVLVDLEPPFRAVENGAAWAVPHTRVLRLSEGASEAVLAGADPAGLGLCQRPYVGVVGGGALVARRDVLLDVPVDERFVGWGQEDETHGWALRTLYGKPWRGDQDLHHLWHPPQPRMDRKRGNPQGWALRQRYMASRNPKAMRQLIEEAKDFALTAHQPGLPDRQEVGVG